ncbi:MAG TPA: hypothetical protein VN906_04225 [Candidatus Sulfotelmatobacter sp.]|nr:hypothetical protein [Candidatus Sulfotelmatobacter sp.]
MDLYTSEKLILDRHHDQVTDGERMARLLDRSEVSPLRTWTAARLRSLADRLDHYSGSSREAVTLFRID